MQFSALKWCFEPVYNTRTRQCCGFTVFIGVQLTLKCYNCWDAVCLPNRPLNITDDAVCVFASTRAFGPICIQLVMWWMWVTLMERHCVLLFNQRCWRAEISPTALRGVSSRFCHHTLTPHTHAYEHTYGQIHTAVKCMNTPDTWHLKQPVKYSEKWCRIYFEAVFTQK